ncbi:MAG TPA: hypothetical protein PK622_03495 [Saprospiraceae bacterium]|nr:hypothetical protein [Saprospiraceae bacterium]HUN15843.1 hypothetical protein [Saprospiraceae bacterium]
MRVLVKLLAAIFIITIDLKGQDIEIPKVLMQCTFDDSTKQNIYKNDIAYLNFVPKSKMKHIKQSKGLKILHISNDSVLVSNSKNTYQICKSEIAGIQILDNKVKNSKSKFPINGFLISGLVLGILGLAASSGSVGLISDIVFGVVSFSFGVIGAVLILVGLMIPLFNNSSKQKLKEYHEGKEIRFNDPRCQCKTIFYP